MPIPNQIETLLFVRSLLVLVILLPAISSQAYAKDKLEITGQKALSTTEGQPITLRLTDFTINGPGQEKYPTNFRLFVDEGKNYTVSGTTVTPDAGFTGTLKVKIQIDLFENGKVEAETKKTEIEIEVKANSSPPPAPDKLTITGQKNLNTTGSTPITLELSDFTIDGPGKNEYPRDFRLEVFSGNNYTVSGTTVTAENGFKGTLTVEIKITRIKDGQVVAESDRKGIKIEVKEEAASPPEKLTITGQKTLSVTGTKAITLELSDFTIAGPGENEYPQDFRLEVFSGNNYTVSGTTVTAKNGFKGTLTVEIKITRIKNGKVVAESDRKGVKIEIKEEAPPATNTAPQIIGQKVIRTNVNQSVKIEFSHLTVVDPDNTYPNGFKLKLADGDNYSVNSGSTVVPDNNFKGTLYVRTVVNDGKADSQPFELKISVVPEDEPETPPTSGPPVFLRFSEQPMMYSLGNEQFFIGKEIEITDPDSEELFYLEIFFDGESFIQEKDQLLIETSGSLSSVFDPNVGMLVLFGRESLATYQQALRTIRYHFANDTLPDERRKVIHFRMNDGENFSAVKSKVVEINETIILEIPNVFSPNEDQMNDVWRIKPQRQIDNFTAMIRVFDKRGELIFETSDLEHYWDGRTNGNLVASDTYFYTIEVRDGAGQVRYQGVVTVLK